jgi:NAD(P)-dependent dehydrogenase (short-subunit alcohol dehydrogenase family)
MLTQTGSKGGFKQMSRVLAGKVTVVTGASSGIGRAIAVNFAAEGAAVVIADIVAEPLEGGESTQSLIAKSGGNACFEKTDVGSWQDIDGLITRTVSRHGRLDVMVNNAATFSGTCLLDTSLEQWEHVMRVNLTGMFYGCKRAIQQMITQEPHGEVRGRVINLGSQQGIVTSPRDTPYGVSKAGAIYLTKQIAVDYAADLIVCNCISPGKIVTGHPGLPMDPALLDNARRRTPWPRLGRPQDIANAAVFLAGDRATYMTGSNLVVDGGWLAR